MKTEAQHTPPPWKMRILDSQKGKEALLQFGDRSLQMKTEDAEFIVRAVNSHEALLEALRELVYKSDGKYFVGIHGDCDVTDIVGKAIAQAEGGK